MIRRPRPILAASLAIPLFCTAHSFAAGLYRDGASARSMSLGGITTAGTKNPIDALSGNPAALSNNSKVTLDITGLAGFVHGTFDNRSNDHSKMDDEGFLGGAAISAPLGPVHFGLGFNPEISMRDRWRYRDTPGGADGLTTYGVRPQESEILLLRTSAGVSWEVCPQFSIGASVGLLYNKNRLKTPYIFQSQPVLRSAKTLLDLETDGYGWNIEAGMLWKPIDTLQIGFSYTSESKIKSDGHASGNAGVQLTNIGLGAAQHDFDYDAEVTNVFPQRFSFGIAWKASPKITLSTQLDWINWQDSFDKLEVRLRRGDNRDLNGLVGSDKLDDDIPLHWRDQFVIRAGIEYNIDEHWSLRTGYAYGRNPVPSRTLLPLTAAIMEHTVSAGVGYQVGRFSFDLAYQWQIPNEEHVRESDLAAGEYSDSAIKVTSHWIGLTATVEF